MTFGDVYSSQCVVRGVQPEQPLVTYRDMMTQVDPSSISQAERLLVYDRICTEQVRGGIVCIVELVFVVVSYTHIYIHAWNTMCFITLLHTQLIILRHRCLSIC